MCLVTKQKEALIAETDIPIWKLLNSRMNAWFFIFQYDLNIVYGTKMGVNNNPGSCFDDIVIEHYHPKDYRELTWVHEGFHSFINQKRALDYYLDRKNKCSPRIPKIAEGIIPKGSLYYVDSTGLIVSNQIKLLCIMK
jgi:hypothetical protein